MKNFVAHSFHIPVLGVGYSVDAPLKVAKYGISSVISLVDDGLVENLRKRFCEKYDEVFEPIHTSENDSRAKRITAYLNFINKKVKEQFAELKKSSFEPGSELNKYISMLPEYSLIKIKYNELLNSQDSLEKETIKEWIRSNLEVGSIDVNIMTKVDKENSDKDGNALPFEFNDAHAALRGFALSDLESSIIFSAGMNPRLYGYAETFKDFLPNSYGYFKKKIVIKVSDYRSALIQGKFLAKKGLWISEFRIESGLNCGGHAFATDGLLLGPILDEFKSKKSELLNALKEIYLQALKRKNVETDFEKLNVRITVQGGVGKESEHEFLLRHFEVDSVGWGSPFLLVPEVMNVDDYTLKLLCDAGEDDLYLSGISPLGVPFNSVRNNSKDIEKQKRIENGKPGSPCPKKFLVFKKEIDDKPICTASLAYMKKINELKYNPNPKLSYQGELEMALEKSCLCEGLSASALIVNGIEDTKQSMAVSVCPGPNLAYYSKVATLNQMVNHIYGKINLITSANRPNMFIKELQLYIKYLQNMADEKAKSQSNNSDELFIEFSENLLSGILFYKTLIPKIFEEPEHVREEMLNQLELLEQKLIILSLQAA